MQVEPSVLVTNCILSAGLFVNSVLCNVYYNMYCLFTKCFTPLSDNCVISYRIIKLVIRNLVYLLNS